MKLASGWRNKFQARRLANRPGPWRLNLGCGAHFHPDWVNLDFAPSDRAVIRHDLRQPLPLPDASCAVVYHSHVLEHFPRAVAPLFLRECHRVLQSGGILRVVVPDLEMIARLYLKNLEGALAGDAQAAQRHEWMTIELLDQLVRERSGGEMAAYWRQNPMPAEAFVFERMGRELANFLRNERAKSGPKAKVRPPSATDLTSYRPPKPAAVSKFRASGEVHHWMYDRWSLRQLLERTGFHDARVCTATESQIPEFADFHLDANEDGSARKPDSLFIEARKP